MEKDATGYLSLLSHDRRTNPGTSRYLASRLPYRKHGSEGGGRKRTQPVARHCRRITGSRTPA